MQKLTMTIMGIAALSSAGCAVTTAGVSPGDERNFVRSLDDVNAGRAIKARMVRADYKLGGVDIEVAEGIAVLTGNVSDPEARAEAERIARSAPDVIQVGNEIKVSQKQGFVRGSKDKFLNAAIRTRLVAEKSVKARNVNIETHDGVVYLLGVARTPEELERIAYIASSTKGTREVISYMTYPNAHMQNASFDSSTPISHQSYNAPSMSAEASAPTYRALPDGLTSQPAPSLPPALQNAPAELGSGAIESGEPYYRDPKTGERITLAPGTKTVPYIPGGGGAAPHYIDPDTGEQIPITYRRPL